MSWARAVALAAAALVPFAQIRIDERLGEHRPAQEVLYLWSGEQVRRLFPGFEALMGDIYWLRTVQYFGGQRVFAKARNFDLLEPLIDITVTLDPRFDIAYRYGATFLAEPEPIGAGRPEAAVKILERGVRASPRSWILVQNLAFFVYFHLGDGKRASEVLLEASKLPGAPVWIANMAADMAARGGDRRTARAMWRLIHGQSEEGQLRRNARTHLDYLDALDAIDAVSAKVGEFRSRTGRNPQSLQELLAASLPARAALDPAGVAFDYDPETGAVSVSTKSPLWRPVMKPRQR